MEKGEIDNAKILLVTGSAGSFSFVMKLIESFISRNIVYIIIQHRRSGTEPILLELIRNRTTLPVSEIEDKEPIKPGQVYLAPPNYHLLFENRNTFSLDNSEKVNYCRPSFDVTFESAADVFGADTTAILLSGANADGAAGMLKIKQAGGITIVQDPVEALVDYMPQQAILLKAHTHIMNTDEMIHYVHTQMI